METKTCPTCKKELDISFFMSDKKFDGTCKIRKYCKVCRNRSTAWRRTYVKSIVKFDYGDKVRCRCCLKIKSLDEFPMVKVGKPRKAKQKEE